MNNSTAMTDQISHTEASGDNLQTAAPIQTPLSKKSKYTSNSIHLITIPESSPTLPQPNNRRRPQKDDDPNAVSTHTSHGASKQLQENKA